MQQVIQVEEIAWQVAEDEHFFTGQSFKKNKKINFVTDMISSVDNKPEFDLEGMTTSPIVDQILAYAMDC